MEEELEALAPPAEGLTREQLELIEDGAAGRLELADQEASNALRNGLAGGMR